MKVRLRELRRYVSTFLFEGRVDDARDSVPDMEEDIFQDIVHNQPAGSNNKYLMWSCAQVDTMMEADPDPQAVRIVIQAVRLFDANQQRLPERDITKYKDVTAVETAVQALPVKSKSKEKQEKAAAIKSDTDTIYEDSRFLVLRPHTQEASCKYGTGTTWCIAATKSTNYFQSYSTSNNKFYFVIDKKATSATPDSKFAIAIVAHGLAAAADQIQIYNAADKRVDMSVVAKHVGEKWSQIWAAISEHVKANPETREVEEAKKAVVEHVKDMLSGKKLSEVAYQKIARNADLTVPVINGLLKSFNDYTGPEDYRDTRRDIVTHLVERSNVMPPDVAMTILRYLFRKHQESDKSDTYSFSSPYYTNRIIRRAPLTPENFREIAKSGDENTLAEIVSNPSAPDDLKVEIGATVENFVKKNDVRAVYVGLIESGLITAEQMKKAFKTDPDLIFSLHGDQALSKLSGELLKLIPVQVTSTNMMKTIIKLPNCPPDYAGELIVKMWDHLSNNDRYELLRSTTLSLGAVDYLWNNKARDARTSLLQNPSIGAETASRFALSKNSAYRFAVAHNPITPVADLEILATDESVSTRGAVAANPATPEAILKQLARDEAVVVRAGVASNKSAGISLAQALKKDSDPIVRKAASQTLKSLERVESYVAMIGSSLILEVISDDEDSDVMEPSWRILPSRSLKPQEFIAVFLLQNNGHATREEIQDAFQEFRGSAGYKDLWKTSKYSNAVFRGTTSSSKGWYWSPPGITKGALVRLTPAGASTAMAILDKARDSVTDVNRAHITSATAEKGKSYYTRAAQVALDITGYEDGEITKVELLVRDGQPVKDAKGKVKRVSSHRSRRAQRMDPAETYYRYSPKSGDDKYFKSFPIVALPEKTKVTYLRPFFILDSKNKAIVKRDEQTLVVEFPLWATQTGDEPTGPTPKNVPTPVRKSPPSPLLDPRPVAAEPVTVPAAPVGTRMPKATYKIYGKKNGKPAHTRLKGQAYGAGADTQFRNGEMASIAPEDGKLRVKKADGDHSQLWDPIDG